MGVTWGWNRTACKGVSMSGYICQTCQGKGIIGGDMVSSPSVVCSYCRGAGKLEAREHWKGIGKLTEECGELLQVAGKAIAFPVVDHPDGEGHVGERFVQEIADVYAALDYFVETNKLDMHIIQLRRESKKRLYEKWELTGVKE